jgi:DNA-binding Xre family transcriptional regulator
MSTYHDSFRLLPSSRCTSSHNEPLTKEELFQAKEAPKLMRLRIAEMAARIRWNMKQLAEALNVDHQTVLYWNQGRAYPRLPMLLVLTRLIGCSINDLLHYDQ